MRDTPPLAAMVTLFCRFEDSFQLLGMAEAGLAPACFAHRHSAYHTPWIAIGFQLCLICALVAFDFDDLLVIDNFFSCTSVLLELAAAVSLRFSHPELDRPATV